MALTLYLASKNNKSSTKLLANNYLLSICKYVLTSAKPSSIIKKNSQEVQA